MLSDRLRQKVDGQTSFSGGMKMEGDLGPTEYRYGENIVVRDGDAETRPGVRRAFPLPDGFRRGFFFNEQNARFADATHTGFWFPFYFFGELWRTIQGVEWYRFNDETEFSQIIVNDGTVYKHKRGLVKAIKTEDELTKTETVEFIQGDNKIVMLRSGNHEPMFWDGLDKDEGFQKFTSAGTTNRIPFATAGAYMFGRLWLKKGRHDIEASDIYDFDTYDEVYQQFGVSRGDSDEIVKIMPFRENFAFVFKKQATYALSGINPVLLDGDVLSNHVRVETVIPDKGMVGPHAFALHGEQITFLSYGGITSVARSTEGKLMGKDVTLSEPIQPLIDRIHWNFAHKCCGTYFKNYLMFAVPLDDSETNNYILVYDLTAAEGKGAWVSAWKSDMIHPMRFFVENQDLYFLDEDGTIKIMWSEDPWDSENVYDDTPIWDPEETFSEGDLLYWSVLEEDRIYRALQDGGGQEVTDTDYFVQVTADLSPEALYPIESELKLRFFYHQDETSPKRYGRFQVAYKHMNPEVSIYTESEDYSTRVAMFSNQEYSQLAYDIAGVVNWDPTNINLDHDNPHRGDYTAFIYHEYGFYTVAEMAAYFTAGDVTDLGIPANGAKTGFFIGAEGWAINVHETHDLRFIPVVVNNNAISVILKNTQGKVWFKSVLAVAQESQFAEKDR